MQPLIPTSSRTLPAAGTPTPEDWRILRLLSLYRLLLVTLLIVLLETGYSQRFFEIPAPGWFRWICDVYGLAALVLLALVLRRRQRLERLTHAQIIVDVAGLGLLVYSCGGIASGLGTLLITPVVAASLLLTPRMSMLHAAIATLAIFAVELLRRLDQPVDTNDFTPAGVLGMMIFGASLAANAVAQRARKSEALAESVGSQFASLSRLNESIIETMLTGVVVVDADERIHTLNAAARRQLCLLSADSGTASLRQHSPALAARLALWRSGAVQDGLPIALTPDGAEVVPHFSRLGSTPQSPALVLLEDAARLREQVQQMKLAALGRLSANIAHEIRNPLSAIHHASQLLSEADAFAEGTAGDNRRLLAMIQRHAERIDKIVKDVLALSRNEAANPAQIDLKPWLVRSAGQYQEGFVDQPRPIELVHIPAGLSVRFDPNHLQQVLFNLWDNAFQHGARGGLAVTVTLQAGVDEAGHPWLDVADTGAGVPEPFRERMFEPFFTTAHQGTGLGLYLARELCEYNQARLAHQPRQNGEGACFRVTFAAEPA